MEPVGRPRGQKVLLPWEIQILEALDITPDDYFNYFDLVQQAKQERNEAFDNIPDVRNEPVTVSIVLAVVGIAFTAASILLAPKPKAPEQRRGGQLRGDDVRGRTKFSPLREFDSVQSLATLSDIVPLIYCNKIDGEQRGGVRAESQLLWSQLKNKDTYQILKVLLLFSGGEIQRRPAFESYAFGSQKIRSYGASRIDMSFAYGTVDQGPLVRNPDQSGDKPVDYPEGTYREEGSARQYFAIRNYYSDRDDTALYLDFCGTQNPSTSATFGQYSPMANGTPWRYPFEYPGKGDGEAENGKRQIIAKRKRGNAMYFSLKSAMTYIERGKFRMELGGGGETAGIYASVASNEPDAPDKNHWSTNPPRVYQRSVYPEYSDNAKDAGGFDAALSAADENREYIDAAIAVGDTFLLGDQIITCTGVSTGELWESNNRFVKNFYFEIDDTYSKYSIISEDDRRKRIDTDNKGDRNINELYRTDYVYPLQRVSIGAASTTRKIDAVEIGIKSTVWRKINSYPNVNQFKGTRSVNEMAKAGYSLTPGTVDRYTSRMSFFRVEYRNQESQENDWTDISPGVPFAVKGNNPQGQYNTIKIYHSSRGQYEYRFIPVSGNCFSNGQYADVHRQKINLLNDKGAFKPVDRSGSGLGVFFKGKITQLTREMTNTKEWNVRFDDNFDYNQCSNSVISDFFIFDAEDSSHRNQAEHEVVFINEIKKNLDSWYADESKHYSRLCYAGMTVAASPDFSNLSDVSAYFTKGIIVERLRDMTGGDFDTESLPGRPSEKRPTSLFPEIAYDLLTNKTRGAGELVGRGEVHEGRMRRAALFCKANGFTWDGVISQEENIRDFIYQQATFCLCDFTIIGGMFALVPSVPHLTGNTENDFGIDFDASVSNGRINIRALFTDGNMRNYKTTFLDSAERENFVAEVKYRQEIRNGFPEMKSFRIRLADVDNDDRNEFTTNDQVEVFDMTQFCTSKDHALSFAKFALQVRQKVDHAIQFETTPDCIAAIAPGDYIRVASNITHSTQTNRINVGCVTTSGAVQARDIGGTQDVWYWKPSQPAVLRGTMTVGADGKVTDAAFHGSLFSVVSSSQEDPKVYKVESISLTEDGMVEVSASYQPLTSDGKLAVLDWADSNFVVTE